MPGIDNEIATDIGVDLLAFDQKSPREQGIGTDHLCRFIVLQQKTGRLAIGVVLINPVKPPRRNPVEIPLPKSGDTPPVPGQVGSKDRV